MLEIPDKCVLCGLMASQGVDWRALGWGLFAKCPRCGGYAFTEGVYLAAFRVPDGLEAIISCATRQSWESTGKPFVLDFISPDLERSIARRRETSVSENYDRLLCYLGGKLRRPSEIIEIRQSLDYPVIDVETPGDLAVYVAWLKEDGLIDDSGRGDVHAITLKKKGWDRLAPSRKVGGEPGTCFVAMWFDLAMNEAYEQGILAAVEDDCRQRALRIDRKEHNNQITDEIMAGIRGAEFMVADFTGHRAGVYYEAGFARGLGREVIYCCREDAFKERHFDTSVINHVVWTDPADLRKKLADRIRASILPKS